MSKIEQALREWAETYERDSIDNWGRLSSVLALRWLAAKIKEAEPDKYFRPVFVWEQPADPEPAPWTFGDLEVGDWFEDGDGRAFQRTGDGEAAFNATSDDLLEAWFAPEDIVHPFEWEWV